MNGLASSIGGSDSLNKILKLQYLYVNYAHPREGLLAVLLPVWQSDLPASQPAKKELSVDPTIS